MSNKAIAAAVVMLLVAVVAIGYMLFSGPAMAPVVVTEQTPVRQAPERRQEVERVVEEAPAAVELASVAPEAEAPVEAASSTLGPRPRGVGLLRGEVVNGLTGDSVDGARITLAAQWDTNIRRRQPLSETHTWETESKADGTFEVRGLPAWGFLGRETQLGGALVVSASKDGMSALRWSRVTDDVPEVFLKLELQPAGAISGQVVDREGAPIEGVVLTARDFDGDTQEARSGTYARGVSDAEGRFVVEHLPEGRWKLAAHSEHHAFHLTPHLDTGTADARIVLHAGAAVSGIVVETPDMAPAPGITVVLSESDHFRSASSGAEGAFTVAALAEGTYTVSIEDEHYVLVGTAPQLTVSEEREAGELRLTVEKGSTIAGMVYDAGTLEGIPGARINARGGLSNRTAYTDEEGYYRLEGLAPGGYTLRRLRMEGYRHREEREDKRVNIVRGQHLEGMDFAVHLGLSVHGWVVDEEGKPLDRVMVQAQDVTGMEGEGRRTGPDGRFECRGFSPGTTFVIEARHETHATPPTQQMTFVESDIEGIEIVMSPGGSIAGMLVDRTGKAVQNYTVEARGVGAAQYHAQPNSDGSFKLTGLMAGNYTLSAHPRYSGGSYKPLQEVTLHKGQTLEGVRLVLEDVGGLTISGRIMNPRREPLARAHVGAVGSRGDEGHGFARSGEDGAYEISGLGEGRYRVSVYSDDYGRPEHVEVEAGARNVDFIMQQFAVIEGTVLGANGRPLEAFEVMHVPGALESFDLTGSMGMRQFFDPGGHFRLENVDPGPVTLAARAAGHGPKTHIVPDVRPGAAVTGVVIRLERGASLEGRVINAAGQPVPGAQVYQDQTPPREHMGMGYAGPPAAATSGADGTFVLDGLAARRINLYVTHTDYITVREQVTLQDAGVTRVQMVMQEGGVVEGTVRAGGKPTQGASVSIHSREGGQAAAQTGPDGAYRIAQAPVGEVQVNANYRYEGANRSASQQAVVASGMVTQVDFAFDVGTATLEGYVTMDGAAADSEGGISVHHADSGANVNTQWARDGAYKFTGLPAGVLRVAVVVHTPGTPVQRTLEVEVRANSTTRLDIELNFGARLTGQVRGLREGEMGQVLILHGHIDVPDGGPMDPAWRELIQHVAGQGHVGSDGTYQTSALEDGSYTVVVGAFVPEQSGPPTSHRTNVQTVEIGGAGEMRLDLNLP